MILPAFVLGLLPKLKIVGVVAVGALAVAAVVYVLSLRAANAELTRDLNAAGAQRDAAIETANDNAVALDRTRADATAAVAALERANAALVEKIRETTKLKAEIDHAKESDDGVVAPVLRRVLDQLRHHAGNEDPARGPGRAAAGAAEPAGLRPLSGAAL
jgi:hypothetical protein